MLHTVARACAWNGRMTVVSQIKLGSTRYVRITAGQLKAQPAPDVPKKSNNRNRNELSIEDHQQKAVGEPQPQQPKESRKPLLVHFLDSMGLKPREKELGEEGLGPGGGRFIYTTPTESGALEALNVVASEKNPARMKQFLRIYKDGAFQRGNIDFMNAALTKINESGIEKDLEMYETLMDVLPKGRYVTRGLMDAIWPQQSEEVDSTLELLCDMEETGVVPEWSTAELILRTFGRSSEPLWKATYMKYWFTKVQNPRPANVAKGATQKEIHLGALRNLKNEKLESEVLELDMNPLRQRVEEEECRKTEEAAQIEPDDAATELHHGDNGEAESKEPVEWFGGVLYQQKLMNLLCENSTNGSEQQAPLQAVIDGPHVHWHGDYLTPFYRLKVPESSFPEKEVMDLEYNGGLARHIENLDENQTKYLTVSLCMTHDQMRRTLDPWIEDLERRYDVFRTANLYVQAKNVISTETNAGMEMDHLDVSEEAKAWIEHARWEGS
eukprot:Clim_evm7s169 gene=Clim_evmTU7s169